ncbi:MAG: hypothetical protein H7Y19_11305, partial [Luteimonas sp.]|nr:hypothetical protein [Luteimonas sp.]
MDDAARTPLFGIATAVALLAGTLACLLLPALPSWPLLAALFAGGFAMSLRGGRLRVAGMLALAALGFGLAGLHAASTLAQQLPPALEQQEATLSGRILDLPQHE